MKKHGFLRKIVLLCLVMMVALTAAAIVLCAVTKAALDAATLGVLMGGWCGELLLTLLKRRFEVEDAQNKDNSTAEGGGKSNSKDKDGDST